MGVFLRQSTIDWNKPQQNIYNLTNLTGFKNRKERRAMRQRLNSNPSAIIYNGNDFYRAGGLGHKWSRRDMRRVARDAQNNWETNYANPEMYNSDVSTAQLGAYNLAGKARIMQWEPTITQVTPEVNTQTLTFDPQAYYNSNDDNDIRYEPSFQQGGQLQTQSDPTEDLLRNAIFGYLGAKDDITSDKALQTVVSAFIQNPESIKEIASNKEMVNRGKKKMQVEDQQNNTQMLQQIMQPGALIQLVNQLVKNNQQTQVAKMGTKLDYIKGLKPFYCPEGQEISFMKLGSKVCPVCKKAHAKNTPHKAEDGEKIEKECGGGVSKMMKGIKAAMKCGGKMKKKMAEGGETEDKTTYTVQQRDSLINAFNKNPNMDTYRKIQRANRTVSDEEDQKKHPQINRDALARLLRGKSK